MKFDMVKKFLSLALLIVLAPITSLGQKSYDPAQKQPRPKVEKGVPRDPSAAEISTMRMEAKKHSKDKTVSAEGTSFYISNVPQSTKRFTILMKNEDGLVLSGTYLLQHVLIFEAIMNEAKKFAQTEEAVGKDKPMITRFFDKQAPRFVVDVMKSAKESHFYVTIKNSTDQITADAGGFRRGDKGASPIFYDMLARVQEISSRVNQ